MCIFMYVYIYIYNYTYMYVFIYIFIYIYIYVHIYVYILLSSTVMYAAQVLFLPPLPPCATRMIFSFEISFFWARGDKPHWGFLRHA